MDELNDLLHIVESQTGASPVVAKFLLSIVSLDKEVNINTLLTKVSPNNIDKMFAVILKMKSSDKIYFETVEKIKEKQETLEDIALMTGL
ncbi:MAG: hypothetical protein GX780_02830 [Campylobacteraceae bacterium]|nr:hypothetical protein [Campylobacteraceae bacterium]